MWLVKSPFRELNPHDYWWNQVWSYQIISISYLYHIYNYYHNHIYIISISYPINVMLKIPLWMVCKCPFSQLNPPKIQLCPGQIWGGRGPALFFRVAIGDVFIQLFLVSKNWNSMVWFTQENDYHAFYPRLSLSMGMHGLYRYTLFVRRCHPSKLFNTSAKPASFGKWFRTSFAEWIAYFLEFDPHASRVYQTPRSFVCGTFVRDGKG